MDTTQAALIEASWSRVAPRATEMAEAFYGRLFELDPRIEDLFAVAEMGSQHAKFVVMLREVVRLVNDPDGFANLLGESGRRHVRYGVVARHYRVVGETLLWALDHVLPDGLDGESRRAWAEAYTRMSSLMQRAGD
jgi:hemoglobin-like flavoprotein